MQSAPFCFDPSSTSESQNCEPLDDLLGISEPDSLDSFSLSWSLCLVGRFWLLVISRRQGVEGWAPVHAICELACFVPLNCLGKICMKSYIMWGSQQGFLPLLSSVIFGVKELGKGSWSETQYNKQAGSADVENGVKGKQIDNCSFRFVFLNDLLLLWSQGIFFCCKSDSKSVDSNRFFFVFSSKPQFINNT